MSWALLMLLCALLPVPAHYFSVIHPALLFHSPSLLLYSSFCFSPHYCLLILANSKNCSTFIGSQTPMTQSSSDLINFFYVQRYFYFNINVLFFLITASVSWVIRNSGWRCGNGSSLFFGWYHMCSRKKRPTWFRGLRVLTNPPFLCLVRF